MSSRIDAVTTRRELLRSAKEYERLGEKLEDREHEILGADGFEKSVQRVAELESTIGIADLAQFTPR